MRQWSVKGDSDSWPQITNICKPIFEISTQGLWSKIEQEKIIVNIKKRETANGLDMH